MANQLKMEVNRLHKLDGEGSTKAFCDILLANSILIKGLRIVEGEKGLFVSMPAEEGKGGKWYSTVIPMSKEVKADIDKLVLEAYGG